MSRDPALERFPEHRKRILELHLSDPSFAETCADYAEVADALEQLEDDAERTAKTRAELRGLCGALEEEIAELLESHR